MSLVTQQDAHAEWLENQADKADSRDERRRKDLAEGWDDCLQARNLDTPIGGGYYDDLIEVLNDACSSEEAINRALMQALIHCAAKGQIEAIEALDKVKEFFVNKTMEFGNGK